MTKTIKKIIGWLVIIGFYLAFTIFISLGEGKAWWLVSVSFAVFMLVSISLGHFIAWCFRD